MPIQVECKCGKKAQMPDSMAGKKILCPDCGEMIQLSGNSPSLSIRTEDIPDNSFIARRLKLNTGAWLQRPSLRKTAIFSIRSIIVIAIMGIFYRGYIFHNILSGPRSQKAEGALFGAFIDTMIFLLIINIAITIAIAVIELTTVFLDIEKNTRKTEHLNGSLCYRKTRERIAPSLSRRGFSVSIYLDKPCAYSSIP